MGALLQSVAGKGLHFTGAVNEVVLCLCRVNLWYHGACPTQQTGTMAGGGCLGGWTGMGTSPLPRLIPRLVAMRVRVVHTLSCNCAVRYSLAVEGTFAPNITKLSNPTRAWTSLRPEACQNSPGSCFTSSFQDSPSTQNL